MAESNPSENPLPSKEELEKLKLKGEIEKINVEIAEAKKPLLFHKELYTAILPIIFGLFGLIFSWYSGYFDTKLDRLDLEKRELKQAVDELQRDSLALYARHKTKYDSLDVIYDLKKDSLQKVHQAEVKKIMDDKIRAESNLTNQVKNIQNKTAKEMTELAGKLLEAEKNSKLIIAQLGVEAGDLARDAGNFEVARRKYNEVLAVNPDAQYPAAQINYMKGVTDVHLEYLYSTYALDVFVTLGSLPRKRMRDDITVKDVPLGNVEYKIEGAVSTQVLSPLTGTASSKCQVRGSGILNIKPDMRVYIVWTRSVNNCTAYLVSR